MFRESMRVLTLRTARRQVAASVVGDSEIGWESFPVTKAALRLGRDVREIRPTRRRHEIQELYEDTVGHGH